MSVKVNNIDDIAFTHQMMDDINDIVYSEQREVKNENRKAE